MISVVGILLGEETFGALEMVFVCNRARYLETRSFTGGSRFSGLSTEYSTFIAKVGVYRWAAIGPASCNTLLAAGLPFGGY